MSVILSRSLLPSTHAMLALLAVLLLQLSAGHAQSCSGAQIVSGNPLSEAWVTALESPYIDLEPLPVNVGRVGFQRQIVGTQSISALSAGFVWVGSNNTAPIAVTFALYGPPLCAPLNSTVLVATSETIIIPPNQLNSELFSVTAPLPTQPIVPAGLYTVLILSDDITGNLSLLVGPQSFTATTTFAVSDYFSGNATAGVFPQQSLPLQPDIINYNTDAAGATYGAPCPTNTPTTLPTCVPVPIQQLPLGVSPLSALPCSGASIISGNEFDSSAFASWSIISVDTVRLVPFTLGVSQTIYSLSLLVLPLSDTSVNYTMRAALYSVSGGSTATLLAQSNVTTIIGAQLAGQYSEAYFPLTTPVVAQAGSLLYVARVVDQAGLVFLVDDSTNVLAGDATVTATGGFPSTTSVHTSEVQDTALGVLGCAAPASAPSSAPSSSSSPSPAPSSASNPATYSSSSAAGPLQQSSTATTPPLYSSTGSVSTSTAGQRGNTVNDANNVMASPIVSGLCAALLFFVTV